MDTGGVVTARAAVGEGSRVAPFLRSDRAVAAAAHGHGHGSALRVDTAETRTVVLSAFEVAFGRRLLAVADQLQTMVERSLRERAVARADETAVTDTETDEDEDDAQ